MSVAGDYVQLQADSFHMVGQYGMKPYASSLARASKDHVLAVSNDGITWSALDTRSGLTSWSATVTTYFDPPKLASAKYFRLIVKRFSGQDK